MHDTPELASRRLAHPLGWASVGLGVPLVSVPRRVASTVGVDDSALARTVVQAAGARELAQAVTVFAAPRVGPWVRLAGDAVDAGTLAYALSRRSGSRRLRVGVALAAVLGITAFDAYAAQKAARTGQHGRGRPGPLQLRASVTVARSPEEVYAFWRDLENLPSFMRHLDSVQVFANGTSTWRATAPVHGQVTWEAEITGDEPGRRLSWQSLPGSDVANSGTVHFSPAPGGEGTEVHVTLHYDVPAGPLGRGVARLLGEEPEQQVRDDLRRFKQIMETGQVVRTDALPEGTDARHQVVQRPAAPVDEKEAGR